MTTTRRVETAQQTLDDLARVLTFSVVGNESRTLLGHALKRMQDARNGLPGAQSFDGDRVTATSSGNPPKGFDQPDPSAGDRALVDELLRRLRADADGLVRVVGRWMPREASPRDRGLSVLNEASQVGCQPCSTVGHYRPPKVEASTVKNTLPEPMALCSACYRFVLTYGRLPSRKQLEDLRDKGSWRETA